MALFGLVCTLVLFTILPLTYSRKSLGPGEIYYNSPVYDINNVSITIGTILPLVGKANSLYTYSSGGIMAEFCQINMINQGLTEFTFKGNFNFMLQKYFSSNQSGQWAVMNLLEATLYNSTTNQPLRAGPQEAQLGVYVNSEIIGNTRLGYGAISGYGIPFLNFGSDGGDGAQDEIVDPSNISNSVNYDFHETQDYTMFNATMSLIKYYNWSLVGSVYQRSDYGNQMYSLVQEYRAVNFYPAFECNVQLLNAGGGSNRIILGRFCDCLKNYNKINVIILWADVLTARYIIEELEKTCATKDTYFIIGDDADLAFPLTETFGTGKYAFAIKSVGEWNFQQYLKECYKVLPEERQQYFRELYAELMSNQAQCENVDRDDLPPCTVEQLIKGETSDCNCGSTQFVVNESEESASNISRDVNGNVK